MNKLLFTIATLFAYSGMFSQTWNTGTGAWISPLSKNIGIQKSLQIGDNVGTDSLWCKTDLNYFEGNVGIGTTAPVAKLHVAINDTTGLEIAHFENNMDNAIMTVHSHGDSSAFYFLQTGGYTGGVALIGTTKELAIINGMSAIAIAIDTSNNITIPDLAGSAQKLVTALADGRLDTASISSIRGYKVYTALLTQDSTEAPVATVMENTLGGIVSYLYNGVGSYSVVATGLLTIGKTVITFGGLNTFDGTSGSTTPNVFGVGADSFEIALFDNLGGSIDILSLPFQENISIEIRVYP